jgi:hypothetical protein
MNVYLVILLCVAAILGAGSLTRYLRARRDTNRRIRNRISSVSNCQY